jgi:intracellular septation protein A
LMVVISVRIIFNILVALLVPLLVVGPVFFFTSITLAKVGIVVGAVLGIIALYFASYFLGVFHVFTSAVWTFTFLELSTKEDEFIKHKVEEEEDSES